jgi:uncharacterized protein YuzE
MLKGKAQHDKVDHTIPANIKGGGLVNFDVNADGEVVAIEVLNASAIMVDGGAKYFDLEDETEPTPIPLNQTEEV